MAVFIRLNKLDKNEKAFVFAFFQLVDGRRADFLIYYQAVDK